MSPYKMQDWVNEILPDGASLSDESAAMLERVLRRPPRPSASRAWNSSPCCRTTSSRSTPRQCAGAVVHRISLRFGHWTYFGLGGPERRRRGNRSRLYRNLAGHRDDADGDESNEQAYAELVEFIRVAAQVVSKNCCRCAGRSIRAAAPALSRVPQAPRMDRQGVRPPTAPIHAHDRQGSHRHPAGPRRFAAATATSNTPIGRTATSTTSAAFRNRTRWRCWCRGGPRPSISCSCASATPCARPGDGARAGTEGAVERYGADDAFPITDIDEILPGLLEQRRRYITPWVRIRISIPTS